MARNDMIRRRDFLAATALGFGSLATAGRLYAAPATSPRFLLVFLRGGYDCANLLVPYSSSFYYESRPHIAIAKPDGNAQTGARALDADWALAPELRESIGTLYDKKQVAFIPFAGTEDLSRSHFETQDSVELGQPTQGARDLRSGFMARLSTVLTGNAPIAFTDAMPLCFAGGANIANVSLKAVGKPVFDARQSQILVDMYAGHRLAPAVAEGLELRQEVGKAMQEEMEQANRGAISAKGFELEAERMARLMRDQYRLGFIDVGGWDTHVNEVQALATNLENLGRGLRAFAQSLGNEWNNTIVVVLSEFGRTFRENGNNGTDHGHGSVHWVLGGALNGGRIAGEQIRVERAALFQDRDYPVLNDYRSVLAGLFGSMWALDQAKLDTIFPGAQPVDLQLV
jgi:uncharacterized protein (DUF1501 family)